MENFVIKQKHNIWFGSFPLLSEQGIINACSCRFNGKSSIVNNTLNLALHVGDKQENVIYNRHLFAKAIGVNASSFTTCEQIHGNNVVVVSEKQIGAGALDLKDTILKTDALVTNLKQVPLLLFYADCVPILLYDKKKKVIGLAHAGWRGTVAGIAEKTVQTMINVFDSNVEDILVGIGPSIGQCCYEIDDSVRNLAVGYEQFFKIVPKKNGHYLLDLWGYNVQILKNKGILQSNISIAEVCTAHNYDLFFSYRSEQGRTGRMGACIMLP